jgi:hypothetical protein
MIQNDRFSSSGPDLSLGERLSAGEIPSVPMIEVRG